MKYSLINRACIQGFLISRLYLLFFFLDIHHLCDVHRHPEQAKPACRVNEFQLCRPKPARISGRVWYILKKAVGFIHGQRDLIIGHKVIRRFMIENIIVCEPCHSFRVFPFRILGKHLVAGQVFTVFNILGKCQGRHVVKEGIHGSSQFFDFYLFLRDRRIQYDRAFIDVPYHRKAFPCFGHNMPAPCVDQAVTVFYPDPADKIVRFILFYEADRHRHNPLHIIGMDVPVHVIVHLLDRFRPGFISEEIA